MTYNLTDHLDVLASNDEDTAKDVGVDVLDVDALDGVLQHEITWRDQYKTDMEGWV